jgi:hypothetical protein
MPARKITITKTIQFFLNVCKPRNDLKILLQNQNARPIVIWIFLLVVCRIT